MRRLIASLLLALALFLSPLAMGTSGGAVMAHPAMSQIDEGCAGSHHTSPDDQKSDMKTNCAIACAALPGSPARLREQAPAPKGETIRGAAQSLTGIWPEGETPPPRNPPEI